MGGSDPLPGDDPRDEAPAGITDDARRDDTTAKTDSTVEASDGSEEEHSNRGLAEVDSTDAVASVSGSDDDEEVEEELTGLAALIRKLALKAEEKNATEAAAEEEPATFDTTPLLSTFDVAGVAEYITSGKAKNVIVMVGAGISVSAGIPDFRTPGTGLYDNLQKYDLPHPTAVFELDYFRENPSPFYLLAKELYPGQYPPTPTHHFIHLLHKKRILLRCFSQNIDSLEAATGLPRELIVPAHGNFDTARCLNGHDADVDEVRQHVDDGIPMRCKECDELVKPDIVFFGENLPERFHTLARRDFPECDLLVIAGTSMEVHPFAGLIDFPNEDVPRFLVNREKVGEMDERMREFSRLVGRGAGLNFGEDNRRDALFLGDCDAGFAELARLLGWGDELDELVRAGVEKVKSPTIDR